MKIVLKDGDERHELELKKCAEKDSSDWAQIYLDDHQVMSIHLAGWRDGLNIHFDTNPGSGRCNIAEFVPNDGFCVLRINGPSDEEEIEQHHNEIAEEADV